MKNDYLEHLKSKQRKNARQVALMIARGENSAIIEKKWKQFIGKQDQSFSEVDVMSLVQWVLREAYLENLADLQSYADKVKFFNEQKKRARAYITELRTVTGKALDSIKASDPELGKPVDSLKEQLESSIDALEKQLGTIGEDAQLANLDLQNALQKQQQTLQMMSSVMKMLHDTAMAIIRKIG